MCYCVICLGQIGPDDVDARNDSKKERNLSIFLSERVLKVAKTIIKLLF